MFTVRERTLLSRKWRSVRLAAWSWTATRTTSSRGPDNVDAQLVITVAEGLGMEVPVP